MENSTPVRVYPGSYWLTIDNLHPHRKADILYGSYWDSRYNVNWKYVILYPGDPWAFTVKWRNLPQSLQTLAFFEDEICLFDCRVHLTCILMYKCAWMELHQLIWRWNLLIWLLYTWTCILIHKYAIMKLDLLYRAE